MNQTSSAPDRLVLSGLNVFISAFGIVSNLAVVVGVCFRTQLHNNCKYLQAGLAAGDAFTCVGIFANQVSSYVVSPQSLLRWQCLLISAPNAAGIMYTSVMTVCIALDRCVAVTVPIRYRNLRKFKCFIGCVCVSMLITGSCTVAMFAEVNLYDKPASCLGSGARGPKFNSVINYFIVTSGIVLLILYPIILITVRRKRRRLQSTSTARFNLDHQQQQQFRYSSRQLEATVAISCVIAAGLVLHILPNMLVLVLAASNVAMGNARSYVSLGSSISSSANCLFYVWKEPKMRCQLRRVFCQCPASTNSVNPNSANTISLAPVSMNAKSA